MSVDENGVDPDADVESITGIGPKRGETLRENGYGTVEDLQEADVAELTSVLNGSVARSIKQRVGNMVERLTTAAQAREQAQKIPGAKAKTVKGPGGKQNPKVLRKVAERHEDGATVEIHKG